MFWSEFWDLLSYMQIHCSWVIPLQGPGGICNHTGRWRPWRLGTRPLVPVPSWGVALSTLSLHTKSRTTPFLVAQISANVHNPLFLLRAIIAINIVSSRRLALSATSSP